jgi:hypothetical protein
MYQRLECIAQASISREKAQGDPARHDYWIDEAIVWLQRAIEARRENMVTREVRDGRMLPEHIRAATPGQDCLIFFELRLLMQNRT